MNANFRPAEPRVDMIYFDAGGGHRASATALKDALEQARRPWRLRMVNLRDLLETLDFVHRVTGLRIENLYNGLLKRGLTIGSLPLLRITQMLIRGMHQREVALLANYWRAPKPDLIVSLIPNFNRAIFEGLRVADRLEKRTATPMVTIMTDLVDLPPHFWIERQEQFVICGTAKAAQQAFAMGHPPQRVFRTSGMIVRPEFYRPPVVCRELERRRLGLHPHLPTGLVMFGGFGSRQMLTIARQAAAARLGMQLIFLCGHNQPLRERIAAMAMPFPFRVEGFTRDIPYFMGLADFFIGKPGPGSISEALVMGLPVIVARDASTMAQERYNTQWIEENRFGLVLRSIREVAKGIAVMADYKQLADFRARVGAYHNRAVAEVPEILDLLIERAA